MSSFKHSNAGKIVPEHIARKSVLFEKATPTLLLKERMRNKESERGREREKENKGNSVQYGLCIPFPLILSSSL